jgi:hypothetical protein
MFQYDTVKLTHGTAIAYHISETSLEAGHSIVAFPLERGHVNDSFILIKRLQPG